jgi:predicted nucleotide-binding protein
MKERFEGDSGRRRLIDALAAQDLVQGDRELAAAIADVAVIRDLQPGARLILQEAEDTDVYLIIAGSFSIVVNGKAIAIRRPGNHVGEMAAAEPSQRRSATVVATELSVVAGVSEEQFAALGDRFPRIWRVVAKTLSRRLNQRNRLIAVPRAIPHVFMMSSTEGLAIAEALHTLLAGDSMTIEKWTDDQVFTASHYTLESLEEVLDRSDFAIAIASSDDMITSRRKRLPAPRDNVIFETGLFMGRLGRKRTLVLEPRKARIKLPSDLYGLTTLRYDWSQDHGDKRALLTPTSQKIRAIIADLGPMT